MPKLIPMREVSRVLLDLQENCRLRREETHFPLSFYIPSLYAFIVGARNCKKQRMFKPAHPRIEHLYPRRNVSNPLGLAHGLAHAISAMRVRGREFP